ncbi:MAG: acetoacetate decarboxylase family protein [Rhodospirillales bacterium]|nr:acetoacetate decarboxylase family protein [Rhodospirillales bacterium]
MPYPLKPGTMYMMPTHFGPMTGPRQGPGGKSGVFAPDQRKTMTVSVRFLTDGGQVEPFLPPGFTLDGEPVVEVFASYMTRIAWLAGRGYNVLGVRVPVVFQGSENRAAGPFLMVLWENLTDPILTGREQLGFSKVYCELPEPVEFDGETHCTASWQGFRFLDMKVRNLEEADSQAADSALAPNDDDTLRGVLHYKYMPRTGAWGEADAAYAVLSPVTAPGAPPQARYTGNGELTFHRARWEDLPTQYMIVNALHGLEIKEYRGATIEHRIGGGDLIDQRIVT